MREKDRSLRRVGKSSVDRGDLVIRRVVGKEVKIISLSKVSGGKRREGEAGAAG